MAKNEILVTSLEAAAQASQVLGSMIPGIGGTIARIAGITFASAAAIANSGKDPEIEIRRIHDSDPLISSVRDEWLQAIRDKFHAKKASAKTSVDDKFKVADGSDVPPDRDTDVDIYDDGK